MKTAFSRTSIAASLTAVAIVVPSAAWWVAGSRAVRQEARSIQEAPRREARLAASRLAEAVGRRLETLREVETRRPFEHYQIDHLSAGDSCACASEASPLAQGLTDPLARAHFQIDEVGRLTVPALPSGSARDLESAWTRDQERAKDALECAASDALAIRREGEAPARANEGVILVGPFRWHTVVLEGRPGLVATREVRFRASVLTQGFLVSTDALERTLEGAVYPAALRAGRPASETAAAVPLEGQPWHVEVDASGAIAEADERAGRELAEFRRSFAYVSGAALLAGLCVVGLVLQSERTARQRARFAAIAAHELRTPLAGLKLYGELLGESLGDPDKRHDYARRVAMEAERLGHVVDNVLGFSGLERSRAAIHPRPGDLGRAVGDVTRQLGPALESRGVRLEVEVEDGLGPVRFDPDALTRMLHNLLDNAEKYSRGAADRRVIVRVGRDGPETVISVRDFGPGVSEGLQGSMFRPFARTERAGDPSGLGLGLAVVRELAAAQGARVWHEVPTGGGSRFAIAFSS